MLSTVNVCWLRWFSICKFKVVTCNLVQSFDNSFRFFEQLICFVMAFFGCKQNVVGFLQQFVTQWPITEQSALFHPLPVFNRPFATCWNKPANCRLMEKSAYSYYWNNTTRVNSGLLLVLVPTFYVGAHDVTPKCPLSIDRKSPDPNGGIAQW